MTAIAIEGLCKSFGNRPVLKNLSLKVEQNQIFGFLGENGAGKTTTIRIITGLLKANGGSVTLFGKRLAEDRTILLRQIGALIEGPAFYGHLSGRANLDILRRLRGLEANTIDEALEAVDLLSAANRRAGQYSHGMKQRLGIAAALLGRPRLVILDEPTNGLDPAGIRAMRDLIRALPQRMNATVMLSSHLLSEVEQTATHVGILHGGKLAFQGSLAALQEQAKPRLLLRTPQRDEALAKLAAFNPEAGEDHDVLWLPGEATAEVQRLLAAEGIVIREMTPERPGLEDLYFQFTGEASNVDTTSA